MRAMYRLGTFLTWQVMTSKTRLRSRIEIPVRIRGVSPVTIIINSNGGHSKNHELIMVLLAYDLRERGDNEGTA